MYNTDSLVQIMSLPAHKRVEMLATDVEPAKPYVSVVELSLRRKDAAVAVQIAHKVSRSCPTSVWTAFSASRVQIVTIVPQDFEGCVFDWEDRIWDILPENLRRFLEGSDSYTDPAKWQDLLLRSVERNSRGARIRLTEAGVRACQCNVQVRHDLYAPCLCLSAGNLRPNTAESWDGERGGVAGNLQDPACIDPTTERRRIQVENLVRAIRDEIRYGDAYLDGEPKPFQHSRVCGVIEDGTFWASESWLREQPGKAHTLRGLRAVLTELAKQNRSAPDGCDRQISDSPAWPLPASVVENVRKAF